MKVKDIKSLRIQGATNIALKALNSIKTKKDKIYLKRLIHARPTEPCLQNAIKYAKLTNPSMAYNYLKKIDKKTEITASKLIKKNMIVFTHCHSSTVVRAMKKAKVKFQVYNTETRPAFQGRKTARELARLKIKVTHFVDSGAEEALKKADIVFLGADMITSKGVVYNKIGSNMISELTKKNKIPLYIITNSWKYTSKNLKIEERSEKEIWKVRNKYIKIRNPAFEAIPNENITAIISEFGILRPKTFVKTVIKNYSWIK